MFRCRVYVKTENKKMTFLEIDDNGEDGRDYSDFGELGLIVESHDKGAIARLVRGYKNFRHHANQGKTKK